MPDENSVDVAGQQAVGANNDLAKLLDFAHAQIREGLALVARRREVGDHGRDAR